MKLKFNTYICIVIHVKLSNKYLPIVEIRFLSKISRYRVLKKLADFQVKRIFIQVKCVITCTNGINSEETDESFTLNADGKSFNMTCGKTKESWTYDVNKICKQ